MVTALEKTNWRLPAVTVILAVAILVLDLELPLGVAGGVPYVAVVLLSLWLPQRRSTWLAAVSVSWLTLLGFFLSPLGGILWMVFFNRFLALFAIWVTAFFCLQCKRAEDMLRVTVECMSATIGEAFFRSMVQHLAAALDVRYALVGELVEPEKKRIRTLAVWNGESIAENFQYELAGTPCENVVGQTTCLYPSGVQSRFAEDHLLAEMGVDSYLGTPLFDAAGEPLGILVVLDVKPMPQEMAPGARSLLAIFAARATVELQRVRAEQELRQSLQTSADIVRSIPAGLFIYQYHPPAGLTLSEANPAAEHFTGVSIEGFRGRDFDEIWPQARSKGLTEALLKVVRTGEPFQSEDFWYRDQRLEGVYRIRAFAMPAGRLGVAFEDVTGLKRAQRQREKLIASLEAQNAELERFAYTVSHDLKTPLITLKAYLDLLQEDLGSGDAEAIESHIRRMTNAADRMGRLLSELLELSRIGRLVNPPEDVPLGELVDEALKLVAGPIAQRGVEVETLADLPMVRGDRPRLREVLQNLIDNSVKHMGDQPRPRIEIGIRPHNEQVLCFVRDNGAGIESRYHQKVFELFDQLDPRTEGSGVGLALAKRIVELHGGRIWVESKGTGHGATFCFTLPRNGPDGTAVGQGLP